MEWPPAVSLCQVLPLFSLCLNNLWDTELYWLITKKKIPIGWIAAAGLDHVSHKSVL